MNGFENLKLSISHVISDLAMSPFIILMFIIGFLICIFSYLSSLEDGDFISRYYGGPPHDNDDEDFD